jgi:O-antigen ligase
MAIAIFWAVTCLASFVCLISPYPVLALGIPVAVGGALMLARKPTLALYVIVAMIPYGAMRKLGGGAVNLPWALAGGLLLLLPVKMAVEKRWSFTTGSSLWPLLISYLLIALVAALRSPFPDDAFTAVAMIIAAQMFVALVIAFGDRTFLVETLPKVITWSITGGSLLGIAGFAFGIAMFGVDRPDGAEYRAVGGAIDPNNQCIMIVFCIPVIVHLVMHSKGRLERLVLIGILGINILGVMLTISRSGLLMCLLALGALAVRYRSLITPRRLGAVVAGGMLSLAVLLAVLPQSFFDRQASIGKWQDRSLSRRSSYLTVAFDAFQLHPLLGSGPDTFKDYYAESDATRLYTKKTERMERQAHNTYVEVLVGTGIVGLTLYLLCLHRAWMHFRLAEAAFRLRGDPKAADLMACYRLGFLVLMLFLLMMTEMYHKYMLLSLGLSQVALRESGAQETPQTVTPVRVPATEPALGRDL